MNADPVGGVARRPGRSLAAFFLIVCCAILGACGGSGESPAAVGDLPSAPSASLQQAIPALGHAMVGRTTVVLNALVAQAPPAEAGLADPRSVVAVARDADGSVRLKQRDGTVREVAPDGTMAVRAGDAAAPLQGDLPPSVIVAVDAANRVQVVDPEACIARTISAEGRVATTLLPPPGGGGACATGARARVVSEVAR